jgi:hypothetical protein
VELDNPSVDGDELAAPVQGFSMPLADILALEVRGFSLDRTVLVVLGTAVTGAVAFVG